MANGTSVKDLPNAVATYLDTPKNEVGAILHRIFNRDAVVHDEGHTHVGLDAIGAWNDGVATAFRFTRTITDVISRESVALVEVRLEGDFPGSPVALHHHFSIVDDKITALTICP